MNALPLLNEEDEPGACFIYAKLEKHSVDQLRRWDMLFSDDAAVATHTQEELLSLMDCFSQASKDFGLTISLKKTNVLGLDTHRQSLAFTTTNSMLSASSPTAAPPSLTPSHWTQKSTRGLGRQLQLSLVARLECGQAPSCL